MLQKKLRERKLTLEERCARIKVDPSLALAFVRKNTVAALLALALLTLSKQEQEHGNQNYVLATTLQIESTFRQLQFRDVLPSGVRPLLAHFCFAKLPERSSGYSLREFTTLT